MTLFEPAIRCSPLSLKQQCSKREPAFTAVCAENEEHVLDDNNKYERPVITTKCLYVGAAGPDRVHKVSRSCKAASSRVP